MVEEGFKAQDKKSKSQKIKVIKMTTFQFKAFDIKKYIIKLKDQQWILESIYTPHIRHKG